MAAMTAAGFSCSLGALAFSNFEDVYTASGTGASTPDPTANVTVSFAEAMSGPDAYGTVRLAAVRSIRRSPTILEATQA